MHDLDSHEIRMSFKSPIFLLQSLCVGQDGRGVGPRGRLLCPGEITLDMTLVTHLWQVAAWLNQAYHAQMIQIGFPSFLAYQASLGRLGSQVIF